MKRKSDTNYIKKNVTILYDKRVQYDVLIKHNELLNALANVETTNGANVEKLKNHEVYSIRTNNKGRILFTYRIINGFNHIIILEILENHEYNRSKFLKKHVLAKFLEKNQAALETVIDADFEPAKLPPSTVPNAHDATLTFTAAYENNGTYIVLDEEQEKSRSAKTPLIIEGPPGSGKTSLAVVLLKQAVENNQRVLYVTQSSLLADKIRNEWVSSSEYIDGKADVLAYKELSADLIDDGKEIFEFWFTGFLRDKIKDKNVSARFSKEIDKVYEEFRIITGYNQKEYIDGIGQKQGLYQSLEDRKWLYTVFTLWKVYLESKNIKLSEFYDCRIENQEHYDLVIVDESQDLSHGQLKNLSKLTINTNIIYCIDPRQNLQDENPKLIYLKNILTNKETNQHPSVVQLSTHYRCPKAIMDFALVFNQLRIQLGPKNKTEAKIADSKIPGGEVEWLELSGNVGLLRLQGMRDDANVCVVTQKEFVQEVKDKLGITQVFMPEQVKGLEYKRVILYKILNTHTLQQVNKALGQGVANEDDMFSAALSACFVAATRATDSLYVVQKEDRLNNHVINKLKEKIVSSANTQSTDDAPHVSTRDEWEARARTLVQNGNHEQARSILINQLGMKEELLITKQLNIWDPSFKNSSVDEQQGIVQENVEKDSHSKIVYKKKRSKRKKNEISLGLLTVTESNSHKERHDLKKNGASKLNKFHDAILDGDFEACKIILKSKRWLANSSTDELSALEKAVLNERLDIVKLLLKYGAQLNIYNQDMPILSTAAAIGNTEIVIELLKASYKQQKLQDFDRSRALLQAVLHGHLTTVITLLNMGVDPNIVDENGMSPLHYAVTCAVHKNRTSLVQILLENGADPNLESKNSGRILTIAISTNNIEAVVNLLKAGANYEPIPFNLNETIQFCIAVAFGKINEVVSFIKKGINVNYQDVNGTNPLYLAAYYGHSDIVTLLIRSGADINLQRNDKNTALHIAAKNGHVKVANALLMANPNLQNDDGATPLHLAVENEHNEVAEELLCDDRIDLEIKRNDGRTSIEIASQKKNSRLFAFIEVLKAKTSLDKLDLGENSPTVLPMFNQTNAEQPILQVIDKIESELKASIASKPRSLR
jgi:ankyrin repeat protein/thymidine kinase